MPRKPRGRFWVGSLLALAAIAAAAAVLAWSGMVYLSLVRHQVEIADACSRVEAASRWRIMLVDNLLQAAQSAGWVHPAELAGLVEARQRLAGLALSPQTAQAAEVFGSYLRAQAGLDSSLSRFWSSTRESGEARGSALDGYASKLTRCEAQFRQGVESLERSVRSYEAIVRRFPGSLVAGFTSLEGRDGLAAPESARTR